ncbi:MAG: hypothetical protein ACJAUV_000634 [Flavobacteriales bacterium]|jgi:hypothetical protein
MVIKTAIASIRKFRLLLVFFVMAFLAIGLYVLFYEKAMTIQWSTMTIVHCWVLPALIVGMILNWSLEIIKWHTLNKKDGLSITNAFRAVMSGICTSLFFPLKTGGFIGRFAFTKTVTRQNLVKRLLISNVSQKLITVLFGGIMIMIVGATSMFEPSLWWLVCSVTIGLIIFIMFKPGWFSQFVTLESLKQLSLSFIRYLIFSTQLFLTFYMFGTHLSTVHLLYIPIYWLSISVIPFSFFGGLLVRETVGASLFGFLLGYDEPSVIFALFVLWIINVFVPACVGWICWLKKAHA